MAGDVTLVDTCGLSCPEPVLAVHAFWKAHGLTPVDVLVDNEVSRENVSRAARTRGLVVTAKAEADGLTRLEVRPA